VSELLNAANEALKSAIQMDPNYYSSRLNMLIWKHLSGERSEIIKKEIELVNLYFPLETAHWVLYALSDVSSGNVNQGQNKLRELSGKNQCASRIICQMDSLDCEVAPPKSMNEKIPEVNLFGDSLNKTRGIGFKKNFVLVPYTSWKVDIYQSQGIDLYNVKFTSGPSYMISELDISIFKDHYSYNQENFSGWEIYKSNNVTFVSNKQIVFKYIDNQLVKSFKL
jgi:hypothetical protein